MCGNPKASWAAGAGSTGALAATGVPVAGMLLLATVLVIGGVLILRAGYLRRSRQH